MEQDLFLNLPPEIMTDVLLRLPIKTIGKCKCVCKSWLDLIKTREFVNSHVSNSAPGLALIERKTSTRLYKILDIVGTQNSGHHCNVAFSFDFTHREGLRGSVNGLVLLVDEVFLFICSPITREYIKLPPPLEEVSSSTRIDNYGFGVSKVSRKYKVVKMWYESCMNGDVKDFSPWPCNFEVYTLGTGSWRRVTASGPDMANTWSCLFFNGNLHWLVYERRVRGPKWIRCFDLETECVSLFSAPYLVHGDNHRTLCALGGNGLCICDISGDDIVMWLMKEYGDDKSWTKEFVIKKHGPLSVPGALVLPIEHFDNGDILFAFRYSATRLCCYSSKTKTSREIKLADFFVESCCAGRSVIYTPSFLSLKTLTMENVCSF